MINTITILNTEYEILNTLEKISIADSFVLPKNKIGGGNGEAKLYIGHYDEKIIEFFGERGFISNCFLTKSNLRKYLDSAYSEYNEPTQNYRYKEELPAKWIERKNSIESISEIISIDLKDQSQIVGPRVYVNSKDKGYSIIREIALPIISYLNVYKLKNSIDNTIVFYVELSLNSTNENHNNLSVNIDDRYVPSDDVEIEKELKDVEQPVNIDIPFNPNNIKIKATTSNIGQIIYDLEDNFINLDTEFQRRAGLWNIGQKSRFIESLLLKLPIPPFYFSEKEENDLEVIDGLQRISVIKSFVIDKDFLLSDLEFLTEYNGYGFDSLPSTLSRRIKTYQISVYIIEKGTPASVKYNIFKRVNTGGLELRPQEIRHAINQGTASKVIAELVRGEEEIDANNQVKTKIDSKGVKYSLDVTREGKEFVKVTNNAIGSFRMEDRDFATRFVSFYLTHFLEYKPDLDTFLNNGMSKLNSMNLNEVLKLKDDFYKAMSLAYDVFGEYAFRKRFSYNDGKKPINKALFETISVCFSKLSSEDCIKLKSKKEILNDKFISLNNTDNIFLRSITQGTARRDSVTKRFTEIERIIKETINYD